MQDKRMKITVGAPVTGSNYFPRKNISDKLKYALDGEHVLFLAPRRTGKTSVLLDLKGNTDVKAIFINLEQFSHPKDWIDAMMHGLSEIQDADWLQKAKQVGELLMRLKTRYVEITEADWPIKSRQLLKDLEQLDEPIWFLLDEFPIMIDQIAKTHNLALAESALHWIRRTRQENLDSKIRFLLTGSIGLDSVLRRLGIRGVANDLRRVELSPLTKQESLTFALRLAKDNSVILTEAAINEYLDLLGLGLWPFFIQLFIAELQDTDPTPDGLVNITAIYQKIVRSNRNQYASNMWDRLRDIFSPLEQTAAKNMLKHVAEHPGGVTLSNLKEQQPQLLEDDFNYVLEVLKHDGYLTETEKGGICFFSNLLRDYWQYKNRL